MAVMTRYLLLALSALASVDALNKALRIGSGGRTAQDFDREALVLGNEASKRPYPPPEDLYSEHFFDTPIDHFQNNSKYAPHSSSTFKNRYWFDTTHYKPGGPVIILQSGETNAIFRLIYMQRGILAQLAEATGGISVVFEHRYYGKSFPTPDLSTKNLRFLTTEQALADEAYFAQNIVFPGMEHKNLTSHTTAYLSYGGSYAGAVSAFLRVKYPDVFWGAISSSGVTEAIYDYWQYYAPVAEYGPSFCMATQKLFTDMADNILIKKASNLKLTHKLKKLFGLQDLTHTADFANQMASGVGLWQSLNWDPAVDYPGFYTFCDKISNTNVIYPSTEAKRSEAKALLQEGGYPANKTLVNQLLNYVGWYNHTALQYCVDETQDQCFSTLNKTYYERDKLFTYEWRSWSYQYCTEWGFLQTGSGVPKNQMPLISRTIDLNYTTAVCRYAFGITKPPAVQEALQYGGYDIRSSRLAIIDGEWDPWRPATPHAFQYGAPQRNSTTDEPFILISKAVHHWDENGFFPNETTAKLPPTPVANTQSEEAKFVVAWMEEYHASKGKARRGEL